MNDTELTRRLNTLREKLREDPEQTRAFSHVLKFFLLMLILTLLARGTSGATMARVELGTPVQYTITHSFQTCGTVTALDQAVISVPAGLVVGELPVQVGDQVEAGAILIRFQAQELDNALLRKEAQLQQMEVQLETLLDSQEVSSDGVTAAQTRRDRANAALEAAQIRLSQEKANLEQAKKTLQAARDALDALQENPDTTAPETSPTEPELTLQEAQAAVSEAEAQVRLAESEVQSAETALENAQYTLADADTQLQQAQKAYTEAREQARRTEDSNAAAASLLQVDMLELREEITALRILRQSGYGLTASSAGILTGLPLQQGVQTSGTERLTIATSQEGYLLTFQVSPETREQLLAARPLLLVKQGTISEEVSLTSANETVDTDGSISFSLLLTVPGWREQQTEISAKLSSQSYSTCVPLSALHQDSRGYFVFVYRSGSSIFGLTERAQRIDVTLLDMDAQYAAISGDLGLRDQILFSSNKPISDGDRIRVMP